MIRSFIRDSVIYTIPSFLSRGLSIFLVPLYTRVLKPSDYGALDMLMVFGSLVNLTVALEVSQGVARYYADERDSDKKILYASTAFWFTLFCYTLFFVVSITFTPTLSRLVVGVDGLEQIFQLGMLYLFLNGLFYLIQNQFRWELRSLNYAVVSLLVTFVTAFVAVILSYVLKWGLVGIMYGMITGAFVGCIYGQWYLRNSFRFRFNWACLKEMLLFSAPLVPSGIAVFLSFYVDRMMINYYLSLDAVGLYGIGFRLASIVGLVMVGFQGALTPLVYSYYRREQTPQDIASIFRFFIAFSLVVFLAIGLFSQEILWLMTTPAYYTAASLVIYLVPAILLSNMYIFTPGIGIAKKTHLILWINLGGAILNIVLNWLLIPSFGTTGAAIAKLLGYACIFAAYMFFSQRLYHVPHNWVPLSLSVVSIAGLAALGSRINLGLSLDIAIKTSLICSTGFLFMVTGLLRWSEMEKAFIFFKRQIQRAA